MIRTFLFLGSFCLLLLAAGGCQQQKPKAAPVLFRVDGREVTLAQFQRAFARSLPPGKELSADERAELQRSYLVQAIDRELTLAEADRLGITVTPAEIEEALAEARSDYADGAFEKMLQERGTSLDDWRRELTSGLLMEKVVQQAAYSKATVSDDEVAAYYRDHREEFDRPDQVRARQIVVATAEEGEHVLGLLRQGQPFAELARQYSLSPDGEEGGDLGFFAPGQMPPEFDATVFKLPVGRLSELVKSPYGYHIFLVEEHRKAKHLSLAEATQEIRANLRRAAEERAYQQWLQDLRARATIEIDMDLLTAGEGANK
jgi:peptidyl-prolyl cis-trans isomerase C